MNRSAWLVWHRRTNTAAIRLFGFAFAGAGASAFRSWPKLLPLHIDVAAVQLPGREDRIVERPLTTLASVVQEIASALAPFDDKPCAFFGHSLGALIAFETARQLRRVNAPLPVHLFLSGRRAAHLPLARRPFYDLPDATLIEEVRSMGGTPSGVLDDAELMALLLPVLRADFALNDRYRHTAEPPLDIPCSLLGAVDDTTARMDEVAAWRALTRADAAVTSFRGGHFFIDSSRREVATLVARSLESWLGVTNMSAAM